MQRTAEEAKWAIITAPLGAFAKPFKWLGRKVARGTRGVWRFFRAGGEQAGEAAASRLGKAFDPKGRRVQIGVDPTTLKPGKNLDSLSRTRQSAAVKHAGDQAITVDSSGVVTNGHHRLKDAIENGRSVDIVIE